MNKSLAAALGLLGFGFILGVLLTSLIWAILT